MWRKRWVYDGTEPPSHDSSLIRIIAAELHREKSWEAYQHFPGRDGFKKKDNTKSLAFFERACRALKAYSYTEIGEMGTFLKTTIKDHQSGKMYNFDEKVLYDTLTRKPEAKTAAIERGWNNWQDVVAEVKNYV